ncbi:MAG: hypothetical protein J0L67_03585 [Cytophagales bacterium]|nr:hypothetical protein [Cytophagales bacterium]
MKFSVSAFMMFALLLACSDNDIQPNKIAKISRMSYSIYNEFDNWFTYHPDGRLDQRTAHAFYDSEDGVITLGRDTATFIYNSNGQISSIEGSEITFLYDERGNLIQCNDYNEFRNPQLMERKYYYNDDNRLYKAEEGSKTCLFTYDVSGNLTTKAVVFNGVEISKTIFLDYDNKPNPFKGNFFIFPPEGFSMVEIDYFSTNNALRYSIVSPYYSQPPVFDWSSFFKYNEDGLWTSGYNDFAFELEYRGN